ncbi:MAG: hypothetical protein CM1200mP16_05210 [Nitrospina sp.]|jgi:hypothetical protein|nr:MAG: hypothetical protein CM1200mP16_05210 [Nitrospina sp.]
MFSGKIILMDTLTVVAVTIIILLGFSVNYLLDPDIRQTALNFVLWIFGALLIFSAVKSFYLGEMSTFTASEGEVRILMDKHPLRFWGSWIFKVILGSFILYFLYNKSNQKKIE